MSATNSQSDKFLYLFRTDTSYDLSKVKEVLHGFYNYSAGAGNTIETTGCTGFKSSFKSIIEKVYNNTPSGLAPDSETEMNTLVIVIMGYADATGLADTASAAQDDHIKWSDLRDYISGTIGPSVYPYALNTEVHVVCITPYCNSLMSIWTTNVPVTCGTLLIPQTSNNSIPSGSGPAFLDSWVSHLKLETSVPLDSYGRISFNDVAIAIHGTNTANYFSSIGPGESGKYFPGYYKFEIKDGDPNLNESTDITIYHPDDIPLNGTGFEFGYLRDNTTSIRNHVKVKVSNIGTHPLKSFRLGLGIYKPSSPIPGSPDVCKYKNLDFIKAGETIEVKISDASFQSPDYANLVVAAVYSDDNDFTVSNISDNKNEAQRSIALINETIDFSTTQQNVSVNGGSDGSITVTGSGGIHPYQVSCTGMSDQSAHPSCTFNGLNAGAKTITVTDSSTTPLQLTKIVTISQPGSGTPICDPRLNNQHILICRLPNGSLKFVFKPLRVRPVFPGFRYYKIRWKVTGLNTSSPATPPNDSDLSNIVITGNGTELIDGTFYSFSTLRVPYSQTGILTLKPRRRPWPFGQMRLEIPTEILFKSTSRFLPLNRYIRIAHFKLLVYFNSLDIRIIS